MPSHEEQHLAAAEEKLRQFLLLADEILAVREQVNHELVQQYERFSNTRRNRVLIGLSLKTLDCFDRLIVDARQMRAECSHHLKTMAEGFIYIHWVTRDQGDTRARLICAEGYRSRASYHKSLGEEDQAKQWRQLQYSAIEWMRSQWNSYKKAKLNDIAREGGVEGHYFTVYKLACEAAHLGDLSVYMPPHEVEAGLGIADLSLLKTYVCLKFGIIMACDLLHDASNLLAMNLGRQLDGFRERWRAIIAIGPGSDSTPIANEAAS